WPTVSPILFAARIGRLTEFPSFDRLQRSINSYPPPLVVSLGILPMLSWKLLIVNCVDAGPLEGKCEFLAPFNLSARRPIGALRQSIGFNLNAESKANPIRSELNLINHREKMALLTWLFPNLLLI